MKQNASTSEQTRAWLIDATTILDLTAPYSADQRLMRGKVGRDHIRPVFLWVAGGQLARVTCQDRDANGNPFSLNRAELVPELRAKSAPVIVLNSTFLRAIASVHKGARLAIRVHPEHPDRQAMYVSINARVSYLIMPILVGDGRVVGTAVPANIDTREAWTEHISDKNAANITFTDNPRDVAGPSCEHGIAKSGCSVCKAAALRAASVPPAPPVPAHTDELCRTCGAILTADGDCDHCGAFVEESLSPVKTTAHIATQRARATTLVPAPKPGTVHHLCTQCGKVMEAHAPADRSRVTFDVCNECDPDTDAKHARASAERAANATQDAERISISAPLPNAPVMQPSPTHAPAPAWVDTRTGQPIEGEPTITQIARNAVTHAPANGAARAKFCPTCGTPAEPHDNYCGECGRTLNASAKSTAEYGRVHAYARLAKTDTALGQRMRAETAREPVSDDTPAQEPAIDAKTRAAIDAQVQETSCPIDSAYSGKNPALIYAQFPDASDVRGFHAWLKVGRAVMKGQKAIRLWAIDDTGEGKAMPKSIAVFDISQTDYARPRNAT